MTQISDNKFIHSAVDDLPQKHSLSACQDNVCIDVSQKIDMCTSIERIVVIKE